MTIAGLVLAGGASRRMGRDKAFVTLGAKPLIAHVAGRLAPQVGPLAVNANGDAGRFAGFGLPVITDDEPGTGPLGGVLAGLAWAGGLDPAPRALVTVPVDGPFLPADLVVRLAGAQDDPGRIVIAASGERDHPVFALWPLAAAEPLAAWRQSARSQGVRGFLAARGFAVVQWPLADPGIDPFFNINAAADLAEAEAWLAAGGGL